MYRYYSVGITEGLGIRYYYCRCGSRSVWLDHAALKGTWVVLPKAASSNHQNRRRWAAPPGDSFNQCPHVKTAVGKHGISQ